ncbi:MAG: argininosuccinate synthase [Phycisphaeraceae bacterium]|nr:argininosuccinate synthase [Phycisphaerae bacterium]MBX3391556.1 argininosuccinate synthase [Phycisphaeraceae bacterium]HRJ49224.1 argininosuccinate synthase [Phycisphaerales bacterium]
MSKLIALAYSGGLDTSAIIPWLRETMDCEVVAVVGDVGQGADELTGIEAKARNSGARECHVVDLKREFVQEYIEPMLLSGAIYEGRYLLGTAIARPLLAKAQVQVARKVGATALAHGCTGKGNDQVRFEAAFAALAPDLEVISPWRVWNLKGRQDLLDYLKKHNVPTTASATKIYSRDRNLWHISHEGGAIEDPWNPPPDDVWMLTADVKDTPDQPEEVTITFEHGRARKLDGTQTSPEVLVERLNAVGGRHGVGRIDLVENRRVGMKSRGLYETPGGTILVEALRGLEEMVLDRETRHWKEHLGLTFAELVYDGRWFTPLREALSACAEKMAEKLSGEIVVRLHKGHATTVRRRSPHALYSHTFASFDMNEVYDQKHAEGFIRLLSLPERIAALKSGGLK